MKALAKTFMAGLALGTAGLGISAPAQARGHTEFYFGVGSGGYYPYDGDYYRDRRYWRDRERYERWRRHHRGWDRDDWRWRHRRCWTEWRWDGYGHRVPVRICR
jgi:hypothetical protein